MSDLQELVELLTEIGAVGPAGCSMNLGLTQGGVSVQWLWSHPNRGLRGYTAVLNPADSQELEHFLVHAAAAMKADNNAAEPSEWPKPQLPSPASISYENPSRWRSLDDQELPARDYDSYYGSSFSIVVEVQGAPHIPCRYAFRDDGWVEAHYTDGCSAADYDQLKGLKCWRPWNRP